MKNSKAKAWLELVISFVLIRLALFLSAGTVNHWQAWVYLEVGAVTNILLTFYIAKDPMLLENRTKGGPTAEKRTVQKIVVLCAGISGVATFFIPALDSRFGWSSVPS